MEFNLADLFEAVADAVPDRTAVVHGDQRLTYRELDDRANRAAHVLAARGIGANDHVGLYLRNGPEHLEMLLGAFKVRAVPINVNDRYVADELSYVIDDAGLVALVWSSDLDLEVARSSATDPASGLRLAVGIGPEYAALLADASSARGFPDRSGDDGYILYTGGTTGRPKGVVWRHEDIFFTAIGGGNPGGPPLTRPDDLVGAVLANPNQRLAPFLPDGDPGPGEFVALSMGPLAHASGQWLALGALLGAGTCVLYDRLSMDVARVLYLVERERVGMLTLVGDASARPLLTHLARVPEVPVTSSLRLLGSGGSILSGDVKDGLLAALPSVVAVLEAIGSSESPSQAISLTTRDARASASLAFKAKDETIVVDDDLRPVEPGSGKAGRLATRGRTPLRYHNDPEKSARTFVEIDGARWSLPGDMATIESDGTIRLLGRGSMCINTGGEKVYPEEVEAVLKTHPAVTDAVVVGTSDARLGEQVSAVVSASDPASPPTLADLRAHCAGQLAGYKAPRDLRVVDAMKRSAAGKPDYSWARDQFMSDA
ncbi:MAG TPA: AMP-binding protein [Acidimicrobiia bacterium]|nr:AMP-binding protein [Acidimicrobiia bacterium]